MDQPPRPSLLITGFGAFPGAPYNPTPRLVAHLVRLRRPAFADITRIGHVFTVAYAAVDRDLVDLIRRHRPDALLMFGLATRSRHIRIETRARNAISVLWPDALAGRGASAGGYALIARDAPTTCRLPAPHARLSQAVRAAGGDARLSHNAGRYLCNYLAWRAVEESGPRAGPRLAAFIHVPPVPRPGGQRRDEAMTMAALERAGEALMRAMVATLRRARSPAPLSRDDEQLLGA